MNKLTIRKPHKPPHVENKQPPFFWESQQFGAYSVAYKQQFCRIETNNRTFLLYVIKSFTELSYLCSIKTNELWKQSQYAMMLPTPPCAR